MIIKQYSIQETSDKTYIVRLFHNGQYLYNYICNNDETLGEKVNELIAQGYHRGYLGNELKNTQELIMQMENLYKFQKKNEIKS